MNIFTVYDKPTDFPEEFVVRRFEVDSSSSLLGEPKEVVLKSKDVTEIRKHLSELGLFRLNRHAKDDPNIVETWI